MIIKKLSRIELVNHIDEFVQILSKEPNEYWDKEHFLKELSKKWNFSLFVENNHKVVGYIIASKKPKCIHIHKFMVHYDSRSKGIGFLLLRKFEELCLIKGEYLIKLKVYDKNRPAIKFYLRNGFNIEKDCDNKLILMCKKID